MFCKLLPANLRAAPSILQSGGLQVMSAPTGAWAGKSVSAALGLGKLLMPICISSLAGAQQEQEWTFQGTVQMRMFMPSGAAQSPPTVSFSMSVKGCMWSVRFLRDEGPNNPNAADYEEVSYDGTN